MTLCRKTLIKVSSAQLAAHANRKSGGCLVASRRILSPMNVFFVSKDKDKGFLFVSLFVHLFIYASPLNIVTFMLHISSCVSMETH